MTEQINLAEIKNIIEENNSILREAIQALKMLSLQEVVLKKAILQEDTPQQPLPPERNYPGYTTPPKYGFM